MPTDRARTWPGRPQVDGTQFTNGRADRLRPMPIEDAAGVDARRAEVGLPPLAEYARSPSETYTANPPRPSRCRSRRTATPEADPRRPATRPAAGRPPPEPAPR